MVKNKRMVSILGVSSNIESILSSYFHLLKPKLDDHWVIDRFADKSEIIISSPELDESIIDYAKVIIIIGENIEVQRVKEQNNKASIIGMLFPINSSKIIETLNKVSKMMPSLNNPIIKTKQQFSLKNLFSRFMVKRKDSPSDTSPVNKETLNKPYNIADKIMRLKNNNSKHFLKIVLLGRPGSGKTTAVTSASNDNVLTSEVSATDSVGLLKEKTTIGIDYCEYESNNIVMRIYGTPGQRRYDYVQSQTVARADIYIILVDLSSVAPFAEFLYYKDIIDKTGNSKALKVAAFTHFDIKENSMLKLSREIRRKCQGEVLTVKIDTRNRDEVRFMLNNVSQMKLGGSPISQHYSENQLFLKNVNA